MVKWTKKKIYINDTFEISLGKFFFVLLITLFQFFGLWADNNWILCGSMFFLVANAFFTLSGSKKTEDMRKELLAESNKNKIDALEKEIESLYISEKELLKIIEAIQSKLNEGFNAREILEEITNGNQ